MWFSEKKLQVSVSDKKLQVQFQIRNCNFQRQSICINTPFLNGDNFMLEVLFMVENGTTSQLTSCWSTFMHSTSSYDAQSKRYAIFKMPTMSSVWKIDKMRDEVLASVGCGVLRWQWGPTCQEWQREKIVGRVVNCQEELRVVSICRLWIVFCVVYFESTFRYECLLNFRFAVLSIWSILWILEIYF